VERLVWRRRRLSRTPKHLQSKVDPPADAIEALSG
jgi:hypothetical protein